MKRTAWLALILTVCLSLSALAEAPTAVLTRAFDIIAQMETDHNYGLVCADSNGAPSIGIIQWNAAGAIVVLRKIIRADDAQARTLLGDALYQEVTGGATSVWNRRKLSAEESSAVSALLKSDAGVRVQKDYADAEIASFIEEAMNLGIRDYTALCYYADIRNQAGSSGIKKYGKTAAELAGGYDKVTLEHLYQAAMQYATFSKSRRQKVYRLLKENPVPSGPDAPSGQTQPTAVSLGDGGVTTLAPGETLTLSPKLKPEGATTTFRYKSANPAVATVEDGVVTAVSPGKTLIAVKTENGLTATLKLKVSGAPKKVKALKLTGASVMTVGQTQTLAVDVKPADAARGVRFRSGNPKIATVSDTGLITAVAPGKARIFARATDGSRVTASFRLRVR